MEDVSGECWLPVVRWEDLYEVSDHGRVRSLPRRGGNNRMYGGRILRPCLQKAGRGQKYLTVSLSRDGKATKYRIHLLVAEAFLGPCRPGQQVRHGPGGALDNRVTNLCYGTHLENMADMLRDGTRLLGSKQPAAKLAEADVAEIRRRHASGEAGYRALGREYGVDFTAIRSIIKGKNWKHVA